MRRLRAAKFDEISALASSADKRVLDACAVPQNLKLRAPDVWIHSRRSLSDFDASIPLFGVEGRKVEVSRSLPADAKITMIEAGASSFDEFAQFASHALIFYSAQMRDAGNFRANAALQPLFISSAGDPHLEANEFYGWFKILK